MNIKLIGSSAINRFYLIQVYPLLNSLKRLFQGDMKAHHQFKNRLEFHLSQQHRSTEYDVSRLSKDMDLSIIRFSIKCWKYLRKSPTSVINDFRLEKTMELLSSGVYSASEAAYLSGFKSFEFYRQYYRKRYRQYPPQSIGLSD